MKQRKNAEAYLGLHTLGVGSAPLAFAVGEVTVRVPHEHCSTLDLALGEDLALPHH